MPANRLAVLMAAPQNVETAMHNDLEAMSDALARRGFREDEILVLEGDLTRSRVAAFLGSAARQIASWKTGSVFLYYTGYGSPTSFDENTAEAALQFEGTLAEESNRESWMSWGDVFEALDATKGVSPRPRRSLAGQFD